MNDKIKVISGFLRYQIPVFIYECLFVGYFLPKQGEDKHDWFINTT